jgi:superfamily I DNA/RNA helicase
VEFAIRPTHMTTAPYLAKLNPEQRRAVEHGIRDPSPLLIIAGAGTGKTNTLAHRVAHLIMQGSDPRRIMLLTFSRRAAVEMIRRVERIAAHVLPDQARLVVDVLTWSGTFHAIGARLLREYAEQIGLDRSFTIHDREDSRRQGTHRCRRRQSIYSFRAATVRNTLDFPDHFTPAAHIITLDHNYRSTQPILACPYRKSNP